MRRLLERFCCDALSLDVRSGGGWCWSTADSVVIGGRCVVFIKKNVRIVVGWDRSARDKSIMYKH